MNAQLSIAIDSSTAIDQAAGFLQECKKREDEANAARIRAEQHLIELIGVKEEGSTTARGTAFKVTTTGKLNRSIDDALLSAIYPSLPPAVRERVFPAKFTLALAELRAIERLDPVLYRRLAAAITTKPAKASVSIEPITTE